MKKRIRFYPDRGYFLVLHWRHFRWVSKVTVVGPYATLREAYNA